MKPWLDATTSRLPVLDGEAASIAALETSTVITSLSPSILVLIDIVLLLVVWAETISGTIAASCPVPEKVCAYNIARLIW